MNNYVLNRVFIVDGINLLFFGEERKQPFKDSDQNTGFDLNIGCNYGILSLSLFVIPSNQNPH